MWPNITQPEEATEASWNLSTSIDFKQCFHLKSLATFVHGGKFYFGRQGVFTSALCQLSQSYSCEVDPRLSSYSAQLAAAASTQSLTQPKAQSKSYDINKCQTMSHQTHTGIQCLFSGLYLALIIQRWRNNNNEMNMCRTRCYSFRKVSKSIRQYWNLNGLGLSVINLRQISVGEL